VGATIEDVARRAEVSVATVSRALRSLPNVAPATRARVLAAAYELDYLADPHASRLAGGRSMTLGITVPTLGTWYHATLYTAVEREAADHGYELRPYTMSGPGGVERFLLDLPFRKGVDGLLVAGAPGGPEELDRLAVAEVPMLTVGAWTTFAPSVRIDDVASARGAVEYLVDLGHRRIGFIGGDPEDPYRFSAAPLDRYHGYLAALRVGGRSGDPRLVQSGGSTVSSAAEAARRLLDLPEPPTAVFACSDEMAFGVLQVARERGLEVPSDLSVVGFDDHELAATIGLTTVRQDIDALGARAAARLVALLADPAAEVEHETRPTRLIVRRTSGPPNR
jgi:LacI family transcriptional regulator, repressor for deo operon, udp, cdd, tsx, nupC, and nupG